VERRSCSAIAPTFNDQLAHVAAFEAREAAAKRLLREMTEAARKELLPLLQRPSRSEMARTKERSSRGRSA